jgi:hypothetical protein
VVVEVLQDAIVFSRVRFSASGAEYSRYVQVAGTQLNVISSASWLDGDRVCEQQDRCPRFVSGSVDEAVHAQHRGNVGGRFTLAVSSPAGFCSLLHAIRQLGHGSSRSAEDQLVTKIHSYRPLVWDRVERRGSVVPSRPASIPVDRPVGTRALPGRQRLRPGRLASLEGAQVELQLALQGGAGAGGRELRAARP